MLGLAILFFIIALIAYAIGATGVAGMSAGVRTVSHPVRGPGGPDRSSWSWGYWSGQRALHREARYGSRGTGWTDNSMTG